MRSKQFRVYWHVNSGKFLPGSYGNMTACKKRIRSAAETRLHWQQQGLCLMAYLTKIDIKSGAPAFAYIYPLS